MSAALVLADTPGFIEVATASLDKTLATWRLTMPEDGAATVEAQRFEAPGAPVFSLARAEGRGGGEASASASASASAAAAAAVPAVWCGLATKEAALWRPGEAAFSAEKARMPGHTGWVRALSPAGPGDRWVLSCGCNHLRQWDATFTAPKEVATASLFTGDILAIAASGRRAFTAGADGSVRAFALSDGRKEGGGGGSGAPSPVPSSPAASPVQGSGSSSSNGSNGNGSGSSNGSGSPSSSATSSSSSPNELRELAHRDRAHDGRVTALAAAGSLVFSVSHDGRVKGWDAETLHLVVERRAAHGGARIHAAAVGPDGLLYTGGDDGLVRRWDPVDLSPLGSPLDGHSGAAVRVLASARAAGGGCLVSGDATGHVAVWAASA